MDDPRIKQIQDFIIATAKKEGPKPLVPGDRQDDIDVIMLGINMLVEELSRQTRISIEEQTKANAALEKISEQKTHFIARVSHELRTPMGGIMGTVNMLKEDNTLTIEQRDLLGTVSDACVDMVSILNDTLDLSKAEQDKMELLLERASIDAIIGKVTRLFLPKAQEKESQRAPKGASWERE